MLADAGQGDGDGGPIERTGERYVGQLRVRPVGGVSVVRHRQHEGTAAVRAFRAVSAVTPRHRTAHAQDSTHQLRRRTDAVRPRTAPSAGHGHFCRGRYELTACSGLQVRFSLSAGRRAESTCRILLVVKSI